MGNVIPFVLKKKKKLSEIHKGNTLCQHGHHKWQVDKDKVFDVKRGKLVTTYHCVRCDATKNISA